MKKKKKNPRNYSLKKLEEELDSINQKILYIFQRYYSFKKALDSDEQSLNKLTYRKSQIQIILRERKELTNNVRKITKIQRLLKK